MKSEIRKGKSEDGDGFLGSRDSGIASNEYGRMQKPGFPFMFLISAFIFPLPSPSTAAPAKDPPGASVLDRVAEGFEPSVFAPGFAAFHLPGSHLRRDSVAYSFEAVVVPRFRVFRSERALLLVDPAFTVRRFDNLPSNPVRTPDYKPRATLYLSPGESPDTYFSFSGWHHSNGEEGSFGDVRPDGGALNDVDGSFSLWGASAAVHWIRDVPLLPRVKSLRVEWLFAKEGGLEDVYPDFAVALSLKSGRFRHHGWAGLGGLSRVFVDAAWSPAPGNALHESLKPEPLSFSASALYAPDWRFSFLPFPVRTGDFWFFGRIYAGPDYYNINFNRPVRRLDFGVMAVPGT
jgi:hypothetical protein